MLVLPVAIYAFWIFPFDEFGSHPLLILSSLILTVVTILVIEAMDRIPLSWGNAKVSVPFDLFLMRFIEVFKALPTLIFIISVSAILDSRGAATLVVLLSFSRWPRIANFTRAELLKVRELDYVESARALGMREWNVFLKHAFPASIGSSIVVMSFGVASIIGFEATLSFLGIGLPDDMVSWGSLIAQARQQFAAWWIVLYPGIAIFLSVYGFNLLGELIQEKIQPDLEQKLI